MPSAWSAAGDGGRRGAEQRSAAQRSAAQLGYLLEGIDWVRCSNVERWLPKPSVIHPWPEQRFLVKHRR